MMSVYNSYSGDVRLLRAKVDSPPRHVSLPCVEERVDVSINAKGGGVFVVKDRNHKRRFSQCNVLVVGWDCAGQRAFATSARRAIILIMSMSKKSRKNVNCDSKPIIIVASPSSS